MEEKVEEEGRGGGGLSAKLCSRPTRRTVSDGYACPGSFEFSASATVRNESVCSICLFRVFPRISNPILDIEN